MFGGWEDLSRHDYFVFVLFLGLTGYDQVSAVVIGKLSALQRKVEIQKLKITCLGKGSKTWKKEDGWSSKDMKF